MIISDTREQTNSHILKYFEKHGIEYEVRKVDTGDYMNTDNPTTRVERKKNLQELAHNLLSPDRARFYREVRRARADGIRLVILCEERGISGLEDVRGWVPKYGRVSGKALADAIFKLYVAYQVPVLYCDKRSTGRRIVELLTERVECEE